MMKESAGQTYSKFDPEIQIIRFTFKSNPLAEEVFEYIDEGMIQKGRDWSSPYQYVEVQKSEFFLALVGTGPSQNLSGVHTMGN